MQEEIDNLGDFFLERTNILEYSVSEISRQLRDVVEDNFSYIRIRGEISGLKKAASGHIYFSLKDEDAVINAICWRATVAQLKLTPEDGLEVRATGKITTYAGRSNYQIIVDNMELTGEGALLKLLEERKRKLAAEGLFDESHKKPLPFMPQTIGVVTSPTGSVIRDILHRVNERFPARVIIWPTLVQGEGAAQQISNAIKGFNLLKQNKPDVIIVARGGGSLEDLWCFNEENVVRAIFESKIPIISAVGHETDTSLADYAADKRAPTPTAAAEIAVPVKQDIYFALQETENHLMHLAIQNIQKRKDRLNYLSARITNIPRKLDEYAQRLDLWGERLNIERLFEKNRQKLNILSASIRSPYERLQNMDYRLNHLTHILQQKIQSVLQQSDSRLKIYGAQLKSLSHQNILNRGYAMVTDENGHVITQKSALPDIFTIHLQDGQQKAMKAGRKATPKKGQPTKSKQGDLFG